MVASCSIQNTGTVPILKSYVFFLHTHTQLDIVSGIFLLNIIEIEQCLMELRVMTVDVFGSHCGCSAVLFLFLSVHTDLAEKRVLCLHCFTLILTVGWVSVASYRH